MGYVLRLRRTHQILVWATAPVVLLATAGHAGAGALTWNNTGGSPADGTTWDIGTNQNWQDTTPAPATYTEGDTVTFNDANNGNYTVAIPGDVGPGSVTVNTANTYTFSGAGGIGGAGTLTKSGAGTLNLNTVNSYTGNTILNGGTLAYGADNTGVKQITFGDVNLSTATSTLNLTNANVTATGLLVQTNTATNNSLAIGAGRTLTINGGVTVGATAGGTSGVVTNLVTTGSGSFVFNGGANNFVVGVSRANADAGTDPAATLNLSTLSNFTATTSGEFRVGYGGNILGTMRLANAAGATNSITAGILQVGNSNNLNNGGDSTLSLGRGTNTINANTINIGNGKSAGVLNFQVGTGGQVTIAGTAGGASTANITVGRQSSASGSGNLSQLALAGTNATVQAGTVIVAHQNNASGNQTRGAVTFDTGTFTVGTSLQIATDQNGDNPAGTNGLFTLGTNAASTGTLDVSGNFIIGNVTNTSIVATKTATATFLMNGGTANVHTNITSNKVAAATTTTLVSTLSLLGGTLNMNGNQIGHAAGTNLNLTNVNMPTTGNTATLMNLGGAGINDAGVNVNGGGTLILAGVHTYSGNTTVANNSTALLNGTWTTTGTYSVASGSTLGGTGSTNASGTVSGTLSPGASIGTFGVGGATLAGNLLIEANDADANVIDRLNDAGNLDITAGTVTFAVTGSLTNPAYVFANYGSLTGSAFATVNNLPSGYAIDYNYLSGNQIALVAAVPEPMAFGLLVMGAPLLMKRRRNR